MASTPPNVGNSPQLEISDQDHNVGVELEATVATSSNVGNSPQREGSDQDDDVGAELEVDPNDDGNASDGDSALGSGQSGASTSISSSIVNYTYENGRRYHAFREGQYMLPNDEREQERMDLHHHIFRMALGGALYRAPLPSDVQRVLDLGTGTGIWALEFADETPSALVIGNDLSPIQPNYVPPNCKFEVDDFESEWTYRPDEAFDYIHGRGLGGSVKDWDLFYSRLYQHLKPGGWVEMHEYEAWCKSDDDPELLKCPSVLQWQQLIDEASIIFGKRVNIAESVKQRMIDAGFEDVRDDVYKVPIGTWPLDPHLKNMGLYQREQMTDCVEPFALAFLTRILKWSSQEAQILISKVRNDFKTKKNHLYINFHYTYGRKPLAPK